MSKYVVSCWFRSSTFTIRILILRILSDRKLSRAAVMIFEASFGDRAACVARRRGWCCCRWWRWVSCSDLCSRSAPSWQSRLAARSREGAMDGGPAQAAHLHRCWERYLSRRALHFAHGRGRRDSRLLIRATRTRWKRRSSLAAICSRCALGARGHPAAAPLATRRSPCFSDPVSHTAVFQ